MLPNPKISICDNVVLIVAIVTVGGVGVASIVTGHDGLDLVLGAITALAMGAPHLSAVVQKKLNGDKTPQQ